MHNAYMFVCVFSDPFVINFIFSPKLLTFLLTTSACRCCPVQAASLAALCPSRCSPCDGSLRPARPPAGVAAAR